MPDLDAFHAWLHKRGRGRSADQYRRVVRRWLDDGANIESMMTSSDYSPNYKRHLIACVRVWAQFIEDGDLLLRIGDIKRPPAVPQTVREPFDFDTWFTIRDMIDSSDALDAPSRNVCGLIALRGIRCGDVLRLTRRDVEQGIDTGTLAYEGKGGRWQNYNAVPLTPYLKGLVACWHRGKRVCHLVSPRAADDGAQASAGRKIRRVFDRVAEDLELKPEDLYAHRFRHTYATYFLQEMGGDPEAIFKLQQQMGWARLDTAANYLRRSRRKELDEVESRLLSGRKR